jgi:hypothetical protein
MRVSTPPRSNARSGSTDSQSEQNSEVEGSCLSAVASVGLSANRVLPGRTLCINTSSEPSAARRVRLLSFGCVDDLADVERVG